jgi:hypothetical protein
MISYIKLQDAVEYIHKLTGVRVPKPTLYSWSRDGKATYDGQRAKLKTTVRFGRLYTREDWVDEFLRQVG